MVAMTDIVTNFWSLGVRPEPDKALEVICEGFRASDGYVVLQIVREHQFFKLAELDRSPRVEGRPALRDRGGLGPAPRDGDPASQSTRGRRRARKLEAAQELTAAGIVAGPSNHAADVDRRSARRGAPHARGDAAHRRRRRAGARAGQPGEAVEDGRRPRDACPWVGEHTERAARIELGLGKPSSRACVSAASSLTRSAAERPLSGPGCGSRSVGWSPALPNRRRPAARRDPRRVELASSLAVEPVPIPPAFGVGTGAEDPASHRGFPVEVGGP